LHYYADLPVADVAAVMGTSENTVKSQLRTGLARLRDLLDASIGTNSPAEAVNG
jgi:DNA-directed RNA polymerase specialized sigma24 family protein